MTTTSAWTRTIIISFLAFIGLGVSAGLLGLAWPSMQKQFNLPLDGVNSLYLVQTAAYSTASFYIGRLMARYGSGNILLLGMVLMSACLFGTALSGTWALVILFTLIAGFGSGLVDAGLNLYVATYHSAQQMNFLHASFGIGITFGPLIMTFALQQSLGWQMGYAITGTVLISIILMLVLTRGAWRREGFATADNKPVRRVSIGATLRRPVVWFSMATFLAYVGLEIGIGQWAYTLLTQSRQVSAEVAGPWVSIYWGAFTGGRILWGVIANRFAIDKVLRYCMLGALVGAILFWWDPVNLVGLLGLIVIGFSQAPIFPMLMAGTPQRVGVEHAENAISVQMAAVGVGTAILPGLIGTIGKNLGLEMMAATFVIMAIVVFIFHELSLAGAAQRVTPVSGELPTK
ncbi:MAG TPA: MFS transporter [Aggregatilineales bacterium]|nr:MFS transporter [Aggregatilineales bacterium]